MSTAVLTPRQIMLRPFDLLVEQGEYFDRGYVIISGKMELFLRGKGNGEDTRLSVLGPRDIISEHSIRYERYRKASVRALTECVLVLFHRDHLLHSMADTKAYIKAYVRMMAEQNQELETKAQKVIRRANDANDQQTG